jgi:hypothetical protein
MQGREHYKHSEFYFDPMSGRIFVGKVWPSTTCVSGQPLHDLP